MKYSFLLLVTFCSCGILGLYPDANIYYKQEVLDRYDQKTQILKANTDSLDSLRSILNDHGMIRLRFTTSNSGKIEQVEILKTTFSKAGTDKLKAAAQRVEFVPFENPGRFRTNIMVRIRSNHTGSTLLHGPVEVK
jgi:hypothetical protein